MRQTERDSITASCPQASFVRRQPIARFHRKNNKTVSLSERFSVGASDLFRFVVRLRRSDVKLDPLCGAFPSTEINLIMGLEALLFED